MSRERLRLWQWVNFNTLAIINVPELPSQGCPGAFLSRWSHPGWLFVGAVYPGNPPRHSPRTGWRCACWRPAELCATARWKEKPGGRKQPCVCRRPAPWRWTPETSTPRWVWRPAARCHSRPAFARCSTFYWRCCHSCAARPQMQTPPAAPEDKLIWNTEDGLLLNPHLTPSI